MYRFHSIILCLLIVVCLGTTSCSSIAPFNQKALENATDLKAESILLMDRATESFEIYEEEVFSLQVKLAQAFEYANALPKNEISAKQWEILIDPERDLLGGFLVMWKEKPRSNAFIDQKKKQIIKSFDEIIKLEKAKVK